MTEKVLNKSPLGDVVCTGILYGVWKNYSS